jgi:hypothetical protein
MLKRVRISHQYAYDEPVFWSIGDDIMNTNGFANAQGWFSIT